MLNADTFIALLEENPVIPAAKDDATLELCLATPSRIVYILYGDLCSIAAIVDKVKSAGKIAIVHIDLIAGLGSKDICVDYIARTVHADGIISTKASLIKRANELGLFTIQRFFMIDYITYANITRHIKETKPDVVELMPAAVSKAIRYLCRETDRPVIASGLILEKDDIIGALDAGALGVSTTNEKLWDV